MNRSSYQQALHREVLKTISTADSGFRRLSGDIEKPNGPRWLLPNEDIKMEEDDVVLQNNGQKINGRVFVTNYRLRFEGNEGPEPLIIDVTLGSVSKVEKKGYSNVNKDSYGLEVHCKDMRNIVFLHKPETHSRRPLYEKLQTYAFPNTNKMPFFATLYSQHFPFDGWSLYRAKSEYQRLSIPNNLWDFTKINQEYKFASTYPAQLVVPTAALKLGDSFLQSVGEFRSKRRIPVSDFLTFLYCELQILAWYDSKSTASITRCAQPMVGMTSKKSTDDEKMIQLIIDNNKQNSRLKILDARPIINAKVNRAKGGGYEDNYANCDLVFLDIENIHVVRESLKKVKDACFPKIDHKHFYKLIDESKWLFHLQTILEGARQAASDVQLHKKSVLVHCSDGWDRTAQITALSMLLLDPYYRTVEGFAVLIEKEWCGCGHKFAHRIGHGEDKHSDEERSPIFVQFIDCVWQLFNQDVKSTTVSLWSYTMAKKDKFMNPLYRRDAEIDASFYASNSPVMTKLWTEYYCRYNPQVVVQDARDGSEEADIAVTAL